MMGKHDNQKRLFSYGVDLDRRVRDDHPLRRILEAVDFSFVREDSRRGQWTMFNLTCLSRPVSRIGCLASRESSPASVCTTS